MPPVVPNPRRIRAFASEAVFETWLSSHHDTEPELWIKIHKKASGLSSVTAAQAVDVALSWGWIDGLRKPFDERSFLQRYTPRTPKSRWSQINREHVARLRAAGRMTPHGQRQVDAAKADGRWDEAYASIRNTNAMKTPAGRERKIAELVAMLARGDTIVPMAAVRPRPKALTREPSRRTRRKAK